MKVRGAHYKEKQVPVNFGSSLQISMSWIACLSCYTVTQLKSSWMAEWANSQVKVKLDWCSCSKFENMLVQHYIPGSSSYKYSYIWIYFLFVIAEFENFMFPYVCACKWITTRAGILTSEWVHNAMLLLFANISVKTVDLSSLLNGTNED